MHQWFLDFYDPPTKQKEKQQLPISSTAPANV